MTDSAFRNPHSALAGGGTLLALDPSSTRTGYAVLDAEGRVLDAGSLTPNRARDDLASRAHRMAEDAFELVRETRPESIVIEIPSVHPNQNGYSARGAGLAHYGFAVGYLVCRVSAAFECGRVTLARPEEWTAGVPKRVRQARLAGVLGDRRLLDPTNHDAADAIGLGLWWLNQRRNAECGMRN